MSEYFTKKDAEEFREGIKKDLEVFYEDMRRYIGIIFEDFQDKLNFVIDGQVEIKKELAELKKMLRC